MCFHGQCHYTFDKNIFVAMTETPYRIFRALARKEKNPAFCMNWEIKHNWEYMDTVSPSVGSVWEQGTKFTIFSLNLV